MLHLFERVSLRLWIEAQHNKELQHHHRSEKYKRICARGFRQLRERKSNDGVHDPMRRTPHALSLRSYAVGKHFADVYPNHRTLRNGEESDVDDEEHEKITLMAVCKEHPGNTKETRCCSDGSD